jgi:hypothetical protein
MRGPTWLTRPAFWIPAVVVIGAAFVIAMAAFQPWRLFIDVTVDEELPGVVSQTSVEETLDAVEPSPDSPTAIVPSPKASDDSVTSTPRETAAQTPTRVVEAEGTFISHEHPTAGKARIITLEDGSRVLRLTDLDTDNGPDLKVWLAAAPVIEGRDGWFVFDDDDYLDLGALKGNKGNQNYPIPADADISNLTSVTIWCDRFSVSFGAAELQSV